MPYTNREAQGWCIVRHVIRSALSAAAPDNGLNRRARRDKNDFISLPSRFLSLSRHGLAALRADTQLLFLSTDSLKSHFDPSASYTLRIEVAARTWQSFRRGMDNTTDSNVYANSQWVVLP